MTLHVSPNGPLIVANNASFEVLRQQFGIATSSRSGIVGAGDLLVTAHGGTMSVDIAAGWAVIAGTEAAAQGSYFVFNDAPVTVGITASHATLNRIDLVVVAVQDAAYSGATNAPVFGVIAGTPGSSPSAPTIPVSPYFNALVLAQVAVNAAVTTITAGNVTDFRRGLSPISRIGASTVTSTQTVSVTTEVTLTGLSVPVLVSGSQRIRIALNVPWLQAGTLSIGTGMVRLYEGVGVIGASGFSMLAGNYDNASVTVERTPSAGVYVYSASIQFGTGAGTGNLIQSSAASPTSLYVDAT